jgi:hypothetical protein
MALATAATAIAAAGGGLLTAGGAPAHAAAIAAPPAAGHTVTITAKPASGASANTTQPCVIRSSAPGAAAKPNGCLPFEISCQITANAPTQLTTGDLAFSAITTCSSDVPQISMGQDVIHSTPVDPNNPLTDSRIVTNDRIDTTANIASCVPGTYAVDASATITLPPDYVIVAGANPIHDTSDTVAFDCGTGGGGGGGGGGCAIPTPTPSASAQPAARRPDIIICH